MLAGNKGNIRFDLFMISAFGLFMVFIFQRFNYGDFIIQLFAGDIDPRSYLIFSLNKITRYLINDLLALLMIWSLFQEKKFVVIALFVQLFGLLILIPTYLILNYYFYAETKSWLNFLHRLTLNPTLLMLLIPAFWYHKKFRTNA